MTRWGVGPHFKSSRSRRAGKKTLLADHHRSFDVNLAVNGSESRFSRSHAPRGNAVLDAPRPLATDISRIEDDAERRRRHSHGGPWERGGISIPSVVVISGKSRKKDGGHGPPWIRRCRGESFFTRSVHHYIQQVIRLRRCQNARICCIDMAPFLMNQKQGWIVRWRFLGGRQSTGSSPSVLPE
ncbi:hypothetical protein SAMN05444166_6063 [Singulisphaera sp. GP187]|nr:hypothetical protein SAMN05444166_6063 [Singulisphaera sp. GP187]